MKKFIASLLIGAQFSIALPAFAQDPVPVKATITLPAVPAPVPGEKDVGAAISPMKKGQVAPFTGIELSAAATATIIAQLNSIQDQVKIEVDHARSEEQAKCTFNVSEVTTHLTADKKVLQAQVDDQTTQIAVLTAQLKKEEVATPSRTTWFMIGGTVGAVVGVGLSALTVYAIHQSSK